MWPFLLIGAGLALLLSKGSPPSGGSGASASPAGSNVNPPAGASSANVPPASSGSAPTSPAPAPLDTATDAGEETSTPAPATAPAPGTAVAAGFVPPAIRTGAGGTVAGIWAWTQAQPAPDLVTTSANAAQAKLLKSNWSQWTGGAFNYLQIQTAIHNLGTTYQNFAWGRIKYWIDRAWIATVNMWNGGTYDAAYFTAGTLSSLTEYQEAAQAYPPYAVELLGAGHATINVQNNWQFLPNGTPTTVLG